MSAQTDQKPVEKIKEKAHQAARSESAPAPVRRYRAVLFQTALIFIAGAFGALTFLVKTTPSFAIDLQITKAIQQINFPSFAWLMSVVSWAGFNPQVVVITVLIILIIYGLGLHWEAVMAVVAAVLSTGVNLLVKDLVQRPRPGAAMVNVIEILNSYSFPSGHVMYYLGFLGFIGFLVFSLMKPSLKRSLFLVLIGIPVVLIGISRIYLGEHWASDVLGSYLLGTLTLVATIQLYRWGKTRFFVHQPVAPEAGSQPA
ncbi:MAG TPA: phosphatase PAP2 family protein [Anaerolineales bacterium]|jgi:undecaprenyl-diphosphatase